MSPAIQLESSVQQVIALRGAYMELWLGGGNSSSPFQEKGCGAGHEDAGSCSSTGVLGVHHAEV